MQPQRCHWCNPRNPLYTAYHDTEWGVPLHDDARLFEILLLETFQAGLSWECVLNKREAFRHAFSGFDARAIARYGERETAALQADKGIIRNRLKIAAAVTNAKVFLDIQRAHGSFDRYIWGFTGGRTLRETGRVSSPLSDMVSKDLRRRGMKFAGTVTVYSLLQAIGVIDSHEPGCFLHREGGGDAPNADSHGFGAVTRPETGESRKRSVSKTGKKVTK